METTKNTFKSYLSKLSAKASEYKAWLTDDKVAEMRAKIKSKKADLGIQFSEEIQHAKEIEEKLEAKIKAAKDATEEKQASLRSEFDDLMNELSNTWNNIKTSVKNTS